MQQAVIDSRYFATARLILMALIAVSFGSCSRRNERERPLPADPKPAAIETISQIAASDSHHPLPPATQRNGSDIERVTHREGAGKPNEDGWCLAHSTRGNFSVMLPGRFVDAMVKSRTTTGGIGVFHTVGTIVDGAEFNVLQIEILGERPADFSGSEGMLKTLRDTGATVTSTKTKLNNHPAERLQAKAPGVSAEFMMFDIGSNHYMLSVQTRKVIDAALRKDIDRFFESFQITEERN